MGRTVGALIVVLYAISASAAVVGQTISVGDATMACPSVATLDRFEKRARDDPALASKDALAAGCQEVTASNQGTINKVAERQCLPDIFGATCQLSLDGSQRCFRSDRPESEPHAVSARAPGGSLPEGRQILWLLVRRLQKHYPWLDEPSDPAPRCRSRLPIPLKSPASFGPCGS